MFWLFVVGAVFAGLAFFDLFVTGPLLSGPEKESKPPHPPIEWL